MKLSVATWIPLVFAACGPSGTAAAGDDEVARLRAEVARLRAENEQLRLAPHVIASEMENAMRARDDANTLAAWNRLSVLFPISAETVEMKKRLDAYQAQRRTEDEEAKRVAALGFKALPVTSQFGTDDTHMALVSTAFGRRWTFDSYGDGWRFIDAEKDRRMLIARLNIASKQKEPGLFGLAAYAPDGATLRRLGEMKYRFVRWSDYGAFLGTKADYRNEFSHSFRIPFTAGASIAEDDLKRRPIYIVATREACHARGYERFGQPPVFYLPGKCESLKPTLGVDDFRGGSLAILKRID